MATDITHLIEEAQGAQQRLADQGLLQEAQIIAELVKELTALSPQTTKAFYTTSEAAHIIGVTAQTIKNWVARGIIKGYRLGGRIVIPADVVDAYRPLADAARSIDPLPSREELIEAIQRGRRPVQWPENDGRA